MVRIIATECSRGGGGGGADGGDRLQRFRGFGVAVALEHFHKIFRVRLDEPEALLLHADDVGWAHVRDASRSESSSSSRRAIYTRG